MTVSPDYQAALESAALFDVSAAGKLEVAGPDAPQFLHNISSNDIKSLPLGGGCETYFCDARAKALFVAWVYHVRRADGNNALWVETTPGRGEALHKYLDRYLIAEAVELTDVSDRFAQFHLAGPNAKSVLETALGEPIPELAEFQHMERTFGPTAPASVRRRDRLGLPGYDVVCLTDRADTIRQALTISGAVPASHDTHEILRIEAGTPVYGIDIDDTRFVMEVGNAARAVSYTKGCFPGQEPIVMARDRAGRVNRRFLGLKLSGDWLPPSGSKIVRDGQDVGLVTSATASPRLGCGLALGYVHWKSSDVGTGVEIVSGSDRIPAEVIGYPPVTAAAPVG